MSIETKRLLVRPIRDGVRRADLPSFEDWRAHALTGFPCYHWNARDPVLTPMRHHTDGGRLLTELRSAWEQCLRRNVVEPASFRLAVGGKR